MAVDAFCPCTVKRRAAFTFVEMMLALAVTVLIGVAVSGMLVSVSYGTTSEAELRRVSTKSALLRLRLNAAVRSSRMVLDQGPEFLVLWMADTRENGKPNLSEIRRLELDAGDGRFWSNTAPAGLPAGDDTQYNLSDDFDALTTALAGTANFPDELWATDVTDWVLTLDAASPQAAAVVSYRLTLQTDDAVDTVSGAATLRTD